MDNMSLISKIGLTLQSLDRKVEKGTATWDEWERYRNMIVGFNISGDKFWKYQAQLKQQLITKDPDAYLQHALTEANKLWPHLDTSYSFDNIAQEINKAFEGGDNHAKED
jgi:hypothetical protein